MTREKMAESQGRRRPPRLSGRHMLTLGAAALAGISGYELWIRLEDFWAWTRGIRHLSAVRGTPFWEDLGIIFEVPEMRQLGYKLLFLALSIVLGIVCLVRRNRARGAWLLILLDVAVAGVGAWLGLYTFRPTDWAQALKLVPLALIFAGCFTNMLHEHRLKAAHEARHKPGPGGVRGDPRRHGRSS